MGMFFNSWKDDDAEYYYGTVSEVGSSNYSRGYDDGYYSGKKAVSDRYDKGYNEGYNKGFKAGLNLYFQKKEPLKKDALEILMDELENNRLSIEASKFLEDVDDPCTVDLYHTVKCDGPEDVINDTPEDMCSEPEPDMSLDIVN